MKITRIRAYRVELPLREGSYKWSGGKSVTVFDSTIVAVETDEGVTGYGEVCPLGPFYLPAYGAGARAGIGELGPHLLGEDPRQLAKLNRRMDAALQGHSYVKSAIDMACWDILGKRARQPVYQLFGGKCRSAVDTYRHAYGNTFEEVESAVRGYLEKGYRHVRAQIGIPGVAAYGIRSPKTKWSPSGAGDKLTWEHRAYVRAVPKLFEHLRKHLGDEVELLHDMHERLPANLAMQVAKDLEPYQLFYLEDPFSPEDVGYFSKLRERTSTPIAMGELFNNPNEYVSIISERLIDFIRIHITQIGGLTPARKVAALCEFFSVRSAWHGPGDVSPVGHAANVHLDLAIPNFGIQEAREFTQAEQDVFPGCPELKGGYYWSNDKPGLGIELDEKLAGKFPIMEDPPFDYHWGNLRRRDGTIAKP
jgi:mannonate dehydratase